METISRSLLTFLLNSLWQIPLLAALAALACRLLRKAPSSHRHAVWAAALAMAILLPATSVYIGRATTSEQFAISPQFAASLQDGAHSANPPDRSSTPVFPALASLARSKTITFAATTATFLLAAYFLVIFHRLVRVVWAAVRTIEIRRRAYAAETPAPLARVWNRCLDTLGVTGVDLLFSRHVSGPVAAGRSIILPESLLAETSEDVLTTAIGHEMAHVARRDFACSLFYELLHLPVSFHPVAWLIRRSLERTREMACDEMVADRLMDASAYARSIMDIAAGMMALPRPGYTLGVFDGDILEERIRRLVERRAAGFEHARLQLIACLSALAVCAVVASTLAVTARAQTDPYGLVTQAEASYERGDYQQAIAQSESAVNLDSANVKARLLLAKALLKAAGESAPWTIDSPAVARARQQYLYVLSLEPANKPALHGMMILTTYTKQFADAHEWALKSIQADARDKDAYYTAGFVDWAIVYPDFATAQKAAGMNPQDGGIIRNEVLRQNLRARHMPRIEEGMRMLETALQLDPEYADAMAYINLLYRIEAGISDSQSQNAELTARADDWVARAIAAKRRWAQTPAQAPKPGDSRISEALAPPPPPPPPPPPGKR